jgi:hypothetical protein
MAKILKTILLGMLLAISMVSAQDGKKQELYDKQMLADNDISDINLDVIDTQFFAGEVKFASGKIALKQMADSIKLLADIGSDLDKYDIPHRGVIVTNVDIKNQEVASNILLKVNDSTFIIPYRYLRSNLDCIADPFLGYACSSFFKKGADSSDYTTNITFSFGACQAGLDFEQVRNIETVVELLTTSHKNMLASKIQAADEAAQQYDYYNKLYDDAVSKKNFAEQIPEMKTKLQSKNSECDQKEAEYNQAKANYDAEKAKFESNLDKIGQLNNQISTFTAQKAALENEQIQKKNSAKTYEDRVAEAQSLRAEIQRGINVIINDVDPNFFNGVNCVTDAGINQFCIDLLNKVR